jgi:two-component system, OmpR family, sensor histidine kinase QseC
VKPSGLLPSLITRVTWTVVVAFAAVFVVLFIVLWREALAHDTGELDRALTRNAIELVAALDRVNSEDAARMVIELLGSPRAPEPGEDSPFLATLVRLDGGGAQQLGPLSPAELLSLPDGISSREYEGRSWRQYIATGTHWKVAVVDDTSLRTREIGLILLGDLATYLAMALPIVLLPVWWVVRHTMAPLRRLSEDVAARAPLDTTPLAEPRRWRELAPLQEALDRLFERTAAGVELEKAFVHDAAHELRTPLAAIATQAHVLAASEGEAREVSRRQLHAAVVRASHLTQQLLRLAQADARTQAALHPVDLMNLARDSMALLSDRAAAQGTELELHGPDALPLQSNAASLRSMLDNLLDNALRYGGPGGTVTLSISAGSDRIELQVADQGPGIAPADHDRVWTRFWRGTEHQEPGTGLGLAIVRQAARSLGGEAFVQSGPPGAVLAVVLPRGEAG